MCFYFSVGRPKNGIAISYGRSIFIFLSLIFYWAIIGSVLAVEINEDHPNVKKKVTIDTEFTTAGESATTNCVWKRSKGRQKSGNVL